MYHACFFMPLGDFLSINDSLHSAVVTFLGMMESSSNRKGVWDEKNDGLHHESSLEGYEHVTLRHYGGD